VVGDPVGRPLLEEGAEALLAFGARPPRGRDRRRLVSGRPLARESLGGADGLGPTREKRRDCVAYGAVEVGRHLVDETDPKRDVGPEALPREEVAPRRRGADLGEDER
jgi:hypothetical protein